MNRKQAKPKSFNSLRSGFLPLAIVSLVALGSIFFVSSSEASYHVKFLVFATMSAAYLIFCFLYYSPKNEQEKADQEFLPAIALPETAENVFSPETREKLLALEEASLLFGSALKPADMFRLVANRVSEIVDFRAMILFLPAAGVLRAAQAFGSHAADFIENPVETARGIARIAFEGGETTADAALNLDRLYLPATALQNLKSAVAVPLRRAGEVYGVLVLYGAEEDSFGRQAIRLAEASAERVSPLFLNSMAFEANLNSALTDSVTGLPNERALFLVLENRIAEAERNRDGLGLTVLSADVKEFDRLNKNYGHLTGDRILSFVAGKIKAQLRQMDFLARAAGDEFLAVLPTASDDIAEAIVARIEKSFAAEIFSADGFEFHVELNFGSASFASDAETASELLNAARRRKYEAKSPLKDTILQFPERFTN